MPQSFRTDEFCEAVQNQQVKMGMKIVLFFVIALATQRSWAISCYRCASFVFPGASLPNQGQAGCKDKPPPEVYQENCANYNGCVVIQGTFRGKTAGGADLNVDDGTLRTCASVGEIDCKYGLEANFDVVYLLKLQSNSTFDGSMCTCKEENCNGGKDDGGGGGSAVRPLAAVLVLTLAVKQFLV